VAKKEYIFLTCACVFACKASCCGGANTFVPFAYVCTYFYRLIRSNGLLIKFVLVEFLYQNPTVDPLKDEVSRRKVNAVTKYFKKRLFFWTNIPPSRSVLCITIPRLMSEKRGNSFKETRQSQQHNMNGPKDMV